MLPDQSILLYKLALVSHVQQFEAHRNQFFTDITDLLCLQHTQMPRTRDLAIYMLTTTTTKATDGQTDCFIPCACVGNKNSSVIYVIS